MNVPWIAVPFDVISFTCPALTCSRKNGLYGTRTRDSGSVARELTQKLNASSASAKTIQPRLIRKRVGFGGVGDDPCGAGGALAFLLPILAGCAHRSGLTILTNHQD